MLEAAVAAHADYLVSGDQDPTGLDDYGEVEIVTPARFDELVPVLYADLAQPELCHYFLDEKAVRACLRLPPVSI